MDERSFACVDVEVLCESQSLVAKVSPADVTREREGYMDMYV